MEVAVLSSDPAHKGAKRAELIQAIIRAGRENSTATVLFHTAVNERMGLGVTDGKTLDLLVRLGPMAAGEIAGHTGLASASVTSLVDRLEEKRFVRRVRDPQDRRRVIVEPILEREEEFAQHFGSFLEGGLAMLAGYDEEQLAVILDFLHQSTRLFQEEAVKLAKLSQSGA
jgi:DNA-binding MarR family transcriptional regulator